MAIESVRFTLQTTADDARIESEAATGSGDYLIEKTEPLKWTPDSPLKEARFIDPVTLTATATLSMLAVRLVNHWLKSKERGVQIDLRTNPATVSRLASVPAGLMVVIDKAGKASMHRHTYDKPEDILPSLSSFLTAAGK